MMVRALILLILVLVAVVLAGLMVGDLVLPLGDVARALLPGAEGPSQASLIVWSIRLPRVLLGLLVGAALAVAGAIAQGVLRNPLADPGLIGINGGAAVAAMIVLVVYRSVSPTVLPVAGFAGASLMAFAIFALSWKGGTSSIRIILVGIGLSALAGSVTTLLSTIGNVGDVQRAMVWLAGSLYDSSWIKVGVMAAWSLPVILVAWLAAHHLDATLLGDDMARGVGQNVQAIRVLLIVLCTLLSGAAVAVAGLVGFIGLVAPHLARRLVGPHHRRLLPFAALVGGILVVAADIASRVVIAPAQLPVGLTIALIGAPFFAWLMWERRNA